MFTGGLTRLHYNVSTSTYYSNSIQSTNTTSAIVYIAYYNVWIKVTVVDRTAAQKISEDSIEFYQYNSVMSRCAGEGNTLCICNKASIYIYNFIAQFYTHRHPLSAVRGVLRTYLGWLIQQMEACLLMVTVELNSTMSMEVVHT